MIDMPLGPVLVDIAGLELADHERRRLLSPLVGGVILFARNFNDCDQLSALCEAIHCLRAPPLLITIDHEGGRVQRCKAGFTRLPAMRLLGHRWDADPNAAVTAARAIGFVLASELRACGVDFSFTPVLDLDWGCSSVIGDRAFHAEPEAVVALAGALINGLSDAGMGSCGKHFPGHGWVKADSHLAIPVDERSRDELLPDIHPFATLKLSAVMPAHVIYPAVDARPAGFSPIWQRILRDELGFSGVVFSDDLSMEGASVAGDMLDRATAAWSAGCDMLLVCNAPDQADHLLAHWQPRARTHELPDSGLTPEQAWAKRVNELQPALDRRELKSNPALVALYQAGLAAINTLADERKA